MAAIFYNAITSTNAAKYTQYNASYPSAIQVVLEGVDPGYARGELVTYVSGGTITSGPTRITGNIQYTGKNGPSAAWPKGNYILYIAVPDAAKYAGLQGGVIMPATGAAGVILPASQIVAPVQTVVSAATILKAQTEKADAVITAPSVTPETPVEQESKILGMNKKVAMGIGGLALVAAYFILRKKKGKKG